MTKFQTEELINQHNKLMDEANAIRSLIKTDNSFNAAYIIKRLSSLHN